MSEKTQSRRTVIVEGRTVVTREVVERPPA